MLKVKNKEKGFTLIEVLISLAILAMVIVPMLSMVLGSVKTNKAGEDKEKALYVAQEYVEKFKNADSFSVGADSDFKDVPDNPDFQYKQTITELDYKFPDKNSNTRTTFSSIEYDGKIEIDSDPNNILSTIKEKNTTSGEDDTIGDEKLPILISDNKPYDNTLEIIDGKNQYDSNDTHENNKIYVKLSNKDSNLQEISINKNASIDNKNGGQKSGYIIILFKGQNQAGEEVPKIQIKASNYCEQSLTIYLAEENNKKVDYSFANDSGKVQVYSNIMVHDGNYANNSRVYKINIEVRKKNGESLQKVTAYKSVAE